MMAMIMSECTGQSRLESLIHPTSLKKDHALEIPLSVCFQVLILVARTALSQVALHCQHLLTNQASISVDYDLDRKAWV